MRLISRIGFAAIALILAIGGGGRATASPAHNPVPSGRDTSNFVLANALGNDIQIESANTGALIKDLGAVPGYTNNGLALSPDGQDVYLTVNEHTSLAIERIAVENGEERFVADGEEPSISPDGRLLAFGTGPEGSRELVVRDLISGKDQSIDLQRLLGGQTDLLNASITWLGDDSEIVVLPGGVGNDLMGGAAPSPIPGSCSAVSVSNTCLIGVNVRAGHSLTAKRIILSGLRSDVVVTGASGSSDLLMADLGARHTVVYKADVTGGAESVIRLLSLPPVLPVAFGDRGPEMFYLVGHGPVALWLAEVAPHRLENARRLNTNVALAGLAT